MAVFLSYRAPSNVAVLEKGSYPPISLANHDLLQRPAVSTEDYSEATITSSAPTQGVRRGFTSYSSSGFGEVFFERIHIIPSFINVGNLVSLQSRDVTVFNAYSENRALQSVLASNSTGITLQSQNGEPYTFSPLEDVVYTITIDTIGDAEIDAKFLFNWASALDSATLSVVGQRIVNIPFPFSSPAKEELSWLTGVITSYDGEQEQRTKLRSSPRQKISVTYPVSGQNTSRANNLLYGWQSRKWAIPMWTEAQSLSSVTPQDTVLNVETANSDYREGGLLFIYSSSTNNSVLEIDSITDSTITLARPAGISASNVQVMPVRIGRITNDPSRATNGYNSTISVTYEITENTSFDSADPEQYRGSDVYFDEVLLSGNSSEVVSNQRVDVNDFNTGGVSFSSPWERPKLVSQRRSFLQDSDEIWNYRLWLHRRAGKYSEFWMPTFEMDFMPANTGQIVSGIDVVDVGYAQYARSRNHIAIKTNNGEWLPREITGVVVNTNNTETLLVDSPLNITYEQIQVISFLDLKRLNTDRVELSWVGGGAVSSGLSVIDI